MGLREILTTPASLAVIGGGAAEVVGFDRVRLAAKAHADGDLCGAGIDIVPLHVTRTKLSARNLRIDLSHVFRWATNERRAAG